jgi:hypothetical protein
MHDLSPLVSFYVGLKQIISFKDLVSKIDHEDSGKKRSNGSQKGKTRVLVSHEVFSHAKLTRWTIPAQVAFSVIVLQVFRRGSILWLGLAILAYAVCDFVTVAMVQLLGPGKISTNLLTEAVVAIFGLIAIWVVWALRDRTVASTEERESQPVTNAG